ncbi:MAG: hypothetical protein KAS32_00100 [Candidatus Peribacteraceae bacterium]|nr:hypothetical protein [Candidatus Peribacteraceae bacterium]
MFEVVVCEKFGWTYEEYMNQPLDFIELIKHKYKVDGKRQTMQSKR